VSVLSAVFLVLQVSSLSREFASLQVESPAYILFVDYFAVSVAATPQPV